VRGLGRAGIEALATAAGALVQLALLVPGASRAGAGGAGFAALAGSFALMATLSLLTVRAPIGVDPRVAARAVARVLAAGGAAVAAGLGLELLLPGAAAIGRMPALALLAPRLTSLTLVFALAAWASGAIRAGDLTLVRDAFLPARAGLRPVPATPRGGGTTS
jgi:hypothetical protein